MKFGISITSIALLVLIAIGFTSPALGEVLCPGQAEGDYCDCEADCSEFPSWCACAEAQASECCATTPDPDSSPSPSHFVPCPEVAVLCPGAMESEICNCETDCSEFPSFCSCDEAQASECCAVPVSTSGVSVKKNTASIHFVGLGIVFSVVSAMIV